MKKYLVGGAVRDSILGREINDRDYVVIGETVESMEAAGFKKVGADFPVFLHPETGEEYALARTERKSGSGYKGFLTHHGQDVTLTDDLERRDLTINAMALDVETGELIDPFGGMGDLRNGILRAVSPAFADDPLRVLRVARFAAKLGFQVDSATRAMCSGFVDAEEFINLTAERVGLELIKALESEYPEKFFIELKEMGVLHVHFKEVADLIGKTQPAQHHPEGDAFEHTMMVLRCAVDTDDLDSVGRFGALVHDFGKGVTPEEMLPKHYGHEEAGVPLVDNFCNRLRLPSRYKQFGMIAAQYHAHVHKIKEMSPSGIVRMYTEIKKNDWKIFRDLSLIGKCDHYGRGGEREKYDEDECFREITKILSDVKIRNVLTKDQIMKFSPDRMQKEYWDALIREVKDYKGGREPSL